MSRRVALACVVVTTLAVAACGSSAPAFPAGAGGSVPLDNISDEFSFANFGAKKSPEVFGANDVVAMFGDGPDVCASGTGDTCGLTAEAATWARMVNQARQTGHCEGFAVMAAARFAQKATPPTGELVNEGDVTHGLMRGFATQFERAVRDEADSWARKSVGEKVLAIDKALAAGRLEYVLGVYTKSGGHAVLPWKVEYVDGDTARIHVYDSNWPGRDRFVTASAKGNKWTFSFRGKDPENDPDIWSGGAGDMDLASMASREDGTCPFCEGSSRVKSSMFVIRAASLDWDITTGQGVLSPDHRSAGTDTARPLKAGDSAFDYLVNVTETDPVTFSFPDSAHVTGITPGAAVEVETGGGENSSVTVSGDSIQSTDPGTVVTLAAGNLVATANGADTEISVSGNELQVHVLSSDGQKVDLVVDQSMPAVEVRTTGNPELSAGVYQIVTQSAPGQVTTLTVEADGSRTEETSAGSLASTSTDVKLSVDLEAPVEDPDLPAVSERMADAQVNTTTTSTSTTTTVAATTTTTRPATSVPVATTTTTPATTTTPPVTTTTTVPTTTTTVPPVSPWVQHLSASSNEQFQQVVTGPQGNILATGYFCGASMLVGGTSLVNPGTPGAMCEVFVEKLTPSGSVMWAQRAGGTAQDFPQAISVDINGGVYVSMSFESTFTFGSSTVTYTKGQGAQYALLKWDAYGAPQWGVAMNPLLTALDVAAGTNTYIVAQIPSGQASVVLNGQTVASNGQTATVVEKIDVLTGAAVWGRMIEGTGSQWFSDSVVDTAGNVAVTGYFDGASLINVGTTLTNSAAGNDEIYVVKFDSSGTAVLARSAGGVGMDEGGYIVARSDGSVYVSFTTDSTSLTYNTNTAFAGVVTQGVTRVGVLWISASGALQSAKLIVSTYIAQVGGLAVSPTGSVFIAGIYTNGSLVLGSTALPNPASDQQLFYAGWDTNGFFTAAGALGGSGTEYLQGGNGCAFDLNGNPILAFDSWSSGITLGSTNYTNQALDAYLLLSNPALQLP